MSARQSALPFIFAAVFTSLGACAKGGADPAKLDELDKRVATLDTRLARIETFLDKYINQPPPPPEPDPASVYAVPIEGAPIKGPEVAPVTVVEAFDFACPYCEKAGPTMDELRKLYGDKIRVAYKFFVVHPDVATEPALAACAAAQQGKYTELEQLIWQKGFLAHDLGADNMSKLAKQAKLDMTRFDADKKGATCAQRVEADKADMARLGVNGTPAFFINGRPLTGARPLADFKQLIDEELAKAEAAIAAGTPVGDYYRVAVLEKGLKELAPPAAQPKAP